MTAPALPALLPIAPAATAPASAARPSSGFATALDDAQNQALGSDAGTPEPRAEATAADDDAPAAVPAEGESTPAEDPAAAVQVLDPAAWVFALAVAGAAPATPATPAVPGLPADAAADPAAAVPAAAPVPAADPAAGVATPALPPGAVAAAGVATPATDSVPGAPTAGVATRATAAAPGAPAPTAPAAPAGTPVAATDPAATLPAGVVVQRVVPAEQATAPTPAPADAAAAAPADLPVAPAAGQEHAGTDPQSSGERPAAQLTPGAAPSAPATATPAAAPAAPAGAAAPPPPPVAAQVAPVVAQLATAANGTSTMTLVLTPETLGSVEVRVTVTNGAVDLTLRHATEAGRAALLDALPDLRRDLESAGLSCSKLDVDRDGGNPWSSQQQTAEQWAAAREAGAGRGRPWHQGPEPDVGRPAPVAHPASSGLDVRV